MIFHKRNEKKIPWIVSIAIFFKVNEFVVKPLNTGASENWEAVKEHLIRKLRLVLER